ncbi:MAG TPA: non-homologous end-joining DNA ligase [Gemmatimonadaceae bacterium]|jgi:bifunctional non-homologous end joining protein LigD|nr:non-homologous end-joining DNA ligase [Gemmatimonadaceae bacterium]
MLAAPAGELPDRLGGWAIEPKWDGIRVIAEVSARDARLWTRNGNDKAPQFPEIADALTALARRDGPLVLDGEIVALDAKGKVLRFQALQGRMHAELEPTVARHSRATRTAFVAFDLLADGDRSLVALPWSERRRALEARVPAGGTGIVRRGESVRCGSAAARRLFERARAEGWEGVLLKRVDAPYAAGRRTPDWRKVKLEREQEFVIGGYTAPTEGAARDHFGALLVGYYDDRGRLHYAGKVGTGYTGATLAMLARRLAPLRRTTSPFVDAPRAMRTATTWVRPELVAQVRYNELTDAGILRQPSFLGLRDDKAARDVRLESEGSAAAAVTNGMRCAS